MQVHSAEMETLSTSQFSAELFSSAKKCREEFSVYSAFIKADAFERFSANLEGAVSGKVIARWQLNDLTAGVSDLEVFEACINRGWKFGLNINLHAKTYWFDNKIAFVGSGNLTNSGLGLIENPNQELGVVIRNPKIQDIENLRSFENEVCWLDLSIYEKIRAIVLDEMEKKKSGIDTTIAAWPSEIQQLIQKPVYSLWVSDLLAAMPGDQVSFGNTRTEETNLLAVTAASNHEPSMDQFLGSRLYSWLVRELREATGYTNFGWLTSRLHTSLIDDPLPSRMTVKEHVKAIFDSIEYCDPPEITIEHFNHTKGLRMVDQS
jgi:hypothetical protein